MYPTAEPTLPLSIAGTGARVQIVEFSGGMRSAHRLAELGLTPGSEVTILNNDGSALLLAVGDTRLGLGRGLAHKVLVTFLERNGS
ncbi:MAG: ferrous iron transport protein A [Chloroflexia bacterium]|nr:ferrous iron transport protein A [Chloroflexia bacterium]